MAGRVLAADNDGRPAKLCDGRKRRRSTVETNRETFETFRADRARTTTSRPDLRRGADFQSAVSFPPVASAPLTVTNMTAATRKLRTTT